MKTAISIPNNVFAEAERLARHMKKSRSELYSLALAEYVARHAPEYVTEAMDRVCAEASEAGQGETGFVLAAARPILEQNEW